jgi:hypothetical protein
MISLRCAATKMIAILVSVSLLFYRCGMPPEGTGTAQGSEAIAIYQAIFAHYETLGAGRIKGIYHETNIHLGDGGIRPDCPESTLFVQTMPAIDEDLIALFCMNTTTAHPIAPDVLTALSLKPIQPRDAPSAEFLNVSSIQVDSIRGQALVFVEMRKGDSRQGAYLLLQRAQNTWIVQDQIEMYIS